MTRTNWITWLAASASLIALGGVQGSCTTTECGEGTIDQGGKCVSGVATDNATCGAGTTLKNGKCAPDFPPTVCDPDTTQPVTDPETGVTTCMGTGGGGCMLACGTPSSGKMSLCGQFLDLETNAPIQDATHDGTACDPTKPTQSGPCSMVIKAYDAIAFAGDPSTAPELPRDEVVINNCGYFRIKNINPSGASFIGIGLADATGVPATHRLSGVAVPVIPTKAVSNIPAYAMTIATDTKWSAAAGLGGGESLATRGVYVGIFLHGQVPVAGVKVVRGGTVNPSQHFYFSDTNPAQRSMLVMNSTQDVTGPNGTAVTIGANTLTTYTGSGAEPGGSSTCKWPVLMGDEIRGVAFIEPLVAVMTSNLNLTCP